MNKYMAIQTTDAKAWNDIMLIVKDKLGSGVNAWIRADSWSDLIETLQESLCQSEYKKGDLK